MGCSTRPVRPAAAMTEPGAAGGRSAYRRYVRDPTVAIRRSVRVVVRACGVVEQLIWVVLRAVGPAEARPDEPRELSGLRHAQGHQQARVDDKADREPRPDADDLREQPPSQQLIEQVPDAIC